MSKIEPIKPEEVSERKLLTIPDEMIQSVNELIVKEWNGSCSKIKQKDILSNYCTVRKIFNRDDQKKAIDVVFSNKWLDFEILFKNAGWNVIYNNPDRDESYEPYFIFEFKKKN